MHSVPRTSCMCLFTACIFAVVLSEKVFATHAIVNSLVLVEAPIAHNDDDMNLKSVERDGN